jgi:hypothetical protein
MALYGGIYELKDSIEHLRMSLSSSSCSFFSARRIGRTQCVHRQKKSSAQMAPSSPAHLCCIGGAHAPRDFGSMLLLDDRNVILALEIEPELGTIAKVTAEPDGGVRRDRPASV